jgi:hypothetical protein
MMGAKGWQVRGWKQMNLVGWLILVFFGFGALLAVEGVS